MLSTAPHYLLYTLFTATTTDPDPNYISVILTAVISTGVFAAIITGVIQYLINRRNSRIQERKNSVDAESDLVARYKEAAAEERAQKESAVQTVRNLLAIASEQVVSLKSTVDTLNSLIDTMNATANAQQDVIDSLTSERDRSAAALNQALAQIKAQEAQLLRHQQEILDLTYPKSVVDALKAQNTDTP